MVNRDSMMLWFGAGAALVGFLVTAGKPPMEWTYQEWLQLAAFVFAWGMGKLATSPLKGESDADTVKRPGGNVGAWFLPILLAGSLVSAPACSLTRPMVTVPVITETDQAQARELATKALSGIEIAGIVVRDARQMVSDLNAAGVVPITVRTAVNDAVIRANGIVQTVITELAAATRAITVRDLTARAVAAFRDVAGLLEAQTDTRVQTAGKFLRSAVGALAALVGVTS